MTSIEWLEEQLNPDMKTMQGNIIQGLREQAKEMHKQEIIKSRENGISEGYRRTNNFYYDKMVDSDTYYQKTFKQPKQ